MKKQIIGMWLIITSIVVFILSYAGIYATTEYQFAYEKIVENVSGVALSLSLLGIIVGVALMPSPATYKRKREKAEKKAEEGGISIIGALYDLFSSIFENFWGFVKGLMIVLLIGLCIYLLFTLPPLSIVIFLLILILLKN